MVKVLVAVVLAVLFLLMPNVLAAPTSYITEEVRVSFFPNGSIDGNVTKTGYIEVDVGNTQDVMQFILLNLSQTSGTNLLSDIAFNGVAASPAPGSRTRIFVNTTDDPQDIKYRILDAIPAPVINMKLDYSNNGLGREINGSNVFLFNLTLHLNYTSSLSGVNLVFQAARDSYGINDSLDILEVSATNGFPTILDSDNDWFSDRIVWTGDLSPSSDTYITFEGRIIPDVNFASALQFVNLNDFNTLAQHSSPATFTGITFTDRFSRGPIREGVELITKDNIWIARGVIRNMAAGLDYLVTGWTLHQIGGQSFTPLVNKTGLSIILGPGDVLYTDRYTSTGSKQFYAAEFDWRVFWGNSEFSGISRSTLYLPTLYQIDSFADKIPIIEANDNAGRRVAVTDKVKHLGHSAVEVGDIHINSTIPAFSISGSQTAWTISDIKVFYTNSTSQVDITSFAGVTAINSNGGNGFVFANITNISAALGHSMRMNDEISLSYKISSGRQPDTQTYSLYSEFILFTLSGTPMKRNLTANITIPGVIVTPPGDGGGGGGTLTVKEFADIVRIKGDVFFVTSNTVDVNVLYRILDTGAKGVRNIKLNVFVPSGGELDTTRLELKVFDKSAGLRSTWERDRDYVITEKGITNIGDRTFREYLIEKKGAGEIFEKTFDLYDGDEIELSYVARIPPGTNYILTRAFGYSFYEDKLIFEDFYTPVRMEGELVGLDIREKPVKQDKAIVGRPAVWIEEYEIYNPNSVNVEDIIKTPVFDDTLSVFLDDGVNRVQLDLQKDEQTYVSWVARLKARENKTFRVEINTPPVLEIGRDTNILEYDRTKVKLAINISLKNFASEDYVNVTYRLPSKKKNIVSAEGMGGEEVSYQEYENGTEIVLSGLSAKQNASISIIYIEIPPVLITYLNNREYRRNEMANLTIIIIPSDFNPGPYVEVEVSGPEDTQDTVFSDLIELEDLKEGREVKLYRTFSVSSFPSGRYTVDTRFRRDFGDILSDRQEFFVAPPELTVVELGYIIAVAVAVIAGFLLFSLIQTRRKKGYKEEIKKLKKEIEKI